MRLKWVIGPSTPHKAGEVRAISVSNFYADRFFDLASFCEVEPMANQLEVHVFQQQRSTCLYLKG